MMDDHTDIPAQHPAADLRTLHVGDDRFQSPDLDSHSCVIVYVNSGVSRAHLCQPVTAGRVKNFEKSRAGQILQADVPMNDPRRTFDGYLDLKRLHRVVVVNYDHAHPAPPGFRSCTKRGYCDCKLFALYHMCPHTLEALNVLGECIRLNCTNGPRHCVGRWVRGYDVAPSALWLSVCLALLSSSFSLFQA